MNDTGVPDQIAAYLGPLLLLTIALAVLWLVLTIIQRTHRRAYNLTKAEGSGTAVKPDFLTVDHARRAAAMAGGRAFDEQRPATQTGSAVASACRMTHFTVIATAVLSFITAAVGALLRIDAMQNAFNQFGTWEKFMAIVSAYKVGFAVAAAVIVVSLLQLFLSLRHRSA